MGRRETVKAPFLCLMVAVLVQSLSTPAYCSRSVEEFSGQKNYYAPSTPHHSSPPNHSSPGGGGYNPPASPSHTPPVTAPAPPLAYDPNVPPFHPGNCSYWAAHPDKIVTVIGRFSTVGDFFGITCVFAYGGKNPTLHDAVANTNANAIGALLREGTAALLNSLACKSFPLTQQQVRSAFAAALGSDGSSAAQAEVFKAANEGRYKS